jgi:hypothetical protein
MIKKYKVFYDTGLGYSTSSEEFTNKSMAADFAQKMYDKVKPIFEPTIHTYNELEPFDEITCDEYLEVLWNEAAGIHELIAEMYWSNIYSADKMFEYMTDRAAMDNITLIDVGIWDYDTAMYECYKNDDDKGLS